VDETAPTPSGIVVVVAHIGRTTPTPDSGQRASIVDRDLGGEDENATRTATTGAATIGGIVSASGSVRVDRAADHDAPSRQDDKASPAIGSNPVRLEHGSVSTSEDPRIQ
jgi:hypothetical protein